MTDKPNNRNLYAVVGMQFRPTVNGMKMADFLRKLPHDEPVVLVRDPSNKYDANAIQVWARNYHVGFIPKDQNRVLSKFIDQQPMAMDSAAGPATLEGLGNSIRAKLHWGHNEHPLVEV